MTRVARLTQVSRLGRVGGSTQVTSHMNLGHHIDSGRQLDQLASLDRLTNLGQVGSTRSLVRSRFFFFSSYGASFVHLARRVNSGLQIRTLCWINSNDSDQLRSPGLQIGMFHWIDSVNSNQLGRLKSARSTWVGSGHGVDLGL